MNYRHAYHAGNFADVFKHLVLCLLIAHLQRKEKAFRVYDTHAGTGLYDLSSEEAAKTGEWINGIGRLAGKKLPEDFARIAASYLGVMRELNPDFDLGMVHQYPGSPFLVRRLLRKQDRLSACELHPADAEVLKKQFEGDYQTRVNHLDGWLAATAHVPPKEKRGLLFIDPPFEDGKDFDRVIDTLKLVHKKWREGMVAFWYPVKDDNGEEAFREEIAALDIGEVMVTRFLASRMEPQAGLAGSALLIKNPPFTLQGDIENMSPVFCELLGVAGETQIDTQIL